MTDTNTDIDVITHNDPAIAMNEGTLEVFPPSRTPSLTAMGTLGEHVENMRRAVYFAEGVCYTEMVPARFRGKPKDAAAAILFGAEVGLTPIAALRSVIVIHGQPGFEARTMKAILKTKGYQFRTIEKSAERAEIWAWEPDSPRVYDEDPDSPHYGKRINPDDEAAWTIEDAIQAGFVPKLKADPKHDADYETNSNGKLKGNLKYIETPKVMLDAKVTAEVCRSIAPHILLGLPYAAEELGELADTITDAIGDDGYRPAPTRRGTRGGLREKAKRARQEKAAPEVIDAETDDAPEPPHGEPHPMTAPDITPEPVPDASPDPEPQPAPDITPEPAPVAEPESEPIAADDPVLADVREAEAATAPAPEPAADGELAMTAAMRSKGEDMLVALLLNASIDADDTRADAISEVLAKRPGQKYRHVDAIALLTNAELKFVVDTLKAWKTKDKLADWLAEAVNAAALREAGLS
ncbi:hypothetical protein ACQ856_18135 [Mycolicibacterium psychrotolerans]|uniref:hypothetical protein n=1 Tax=Mycolicibacterium psychrotolerans TaxID=216929 RepID=UPI003D676707